MKNCLSLIAGGTKNKISGTRAKQIKKYASTMYLNTKEMFSSLVHFKGFSGDEQEMINTLKEDMTSFNSVSYFSGGVLKFEATAEVPSKYKNGAKYLLHIIDNGMKAMD